MSSLANVDLISLVLLGLKFVSLNYADISTTFLERMELQSARCQKIIKKIKIEKILVCSVHVVFFL